MTKIIKASCDENIREDFRIHIKMIEIEIDQGRKVDFDEMFTKLEEKHANLVNQKK